jgi:hypothetical protein
MLDLEEIGALQTLGDQKINSLPEAELDPLIGYCSLLGKDISRLAAHQKVSTDAATTHAFRLGIALGLEVQIKDGQLQRRP